MVNSKVLHFANIWENVSDIIPDEIAVISGNDTKTWKEYENTSARIASFLNSRGIKDIESSTVTSEFGGKFKNKETKREFLDYIQLETKF